MKTPPRFALLFLTLASALPPSDAAPAGQVQATVAARGPHHRVWQRVTPETLPNGAVRWQTNSWVELQCGLHRWADNQWIDASPAIELFNDGAVIRGLQYQAIFAPNLATAGAIDLSFPGGKRFRGQIVGLAYTDGDRSVMIAEVKDCGAEVSGAERNRLTYHNAFTDFDIDVEFVARRGRFSQNVILRQQLPPPEEYGLSEHAVLELLTEFSESPPLELRQAVLTPSARLPQGAVDYHISAGDIQFAPGKAFRAGAEHGRALRVTKQWEVLSGRNFLIESIPAAVLQQETKDLPPPPPVTAQMRRSGLRRELWAARKPPGVRPTAQTLRPIQMARSEWRRAPGYKIDYELALSASNFTFRADTTYFVTGEMQLDGNTTIEGGTVVKYTNVLADIGLKFAAESTITCRTAPYRPAVFTSMHDDTVGEILPNSTGAPTTASNQSHYLYVFTGSGSVLKHIRVCYAYYGLSYEFYSGHHDLRHAQFVKCHTPIFADSVTFYLGNVLFYQMQQGFYGFDYDGAIEHATIHDCAALTQDYGELAFTNSIFARVTNWGNSTITTNSVHVTSDSSIFQTVGAASHYLCDRSPLRDAGTNNIDPELRADLKGMTTHPPVVHTNGYYTLDLTLTEQAPRDTDALDLGAHYDPIDYALTMRLITNATVTVQSGVVLGAFAEVSGAYGLGVWDGAVLQVNGTAERPCWIVRYNTVQEQATTNWGSFAGDGAILTPWLSVAAAPTASFRFTHWSILGQANKHFVGYNVETCNPVSWTHCRFHGGVMINYAPSLLFTNCMFDRVKAQIHDYGSGATVRHQNNLFSGGSYEMFHLGGGNWQFADNLFDKTVILQNASLTHDYNAFVTNSAMTNAMWFSTLATNELVFTCTALDFQSGPFGDHYYPTNGTLLGTLTTNAGSTWATNVGLYHFTTTTNQVKEAATAVDMGFHYVALGMDGAPLDSDGDGVPDYVEDNNGNGVQDGGEEDWATYESLHELTAGQWLELFTPLK